MYTPPGISIQTSFENPLTGLVNGVRTPVMIGTGSEILSRSNIEIIRGSSSFVDQKITSEDVAGRAVASVSTTGVVTLGDYDGVLDKIQVRKYPIVDGVGSGTKSTKTTDVGVTINGIPIVVRAISATNGILTLTRAPEVGDEVRVTYFFKRTDTLITDDLSDQVDEEAASLYGTVGESYEIVTGDNDVLSLTVDGTSLSITIPPTSSTSWTATQIAAFINGQVGNTSLVASSAENNYGQNVLLLVADSDVTVGSGSINSTLGFSTGQSTGRNRVFYTFQGPIVDGSNSGVTTTDVSDVTVTVDGIKVTPTSVDGTSRAVTLPTAPPSGSKVLVTYYYNPWQDTFDYLPDVDVISITSCGVSPDRSDFSNEVDFILKGDKVVWGTSALVGVGEHTVDTVFFGEDQVSATLVDSKIYLDPCSAYVDQTVSPPRESRKKFVLSRVPTTGNGRGSPLGSSLFQTVSNDRIDLPTNRPDLVLAYWGYSIQDAAARGPVKVVEVDSASSTFTLKSDVPVGASVWATYYYNNLSDDEYSLVVTTAGSSGVGTYNILNSEGDVLLNPKYSSKSSGLSTITINFPSGSERKSDLRFEIPSSSTYYTGPVEEDVTVTFASTDSTLAHFTTPGYGDYDLILNASDRIRIVVDGSALAGGAGGIDLGSVMGVANLGFAASLLGDEISYDADSGYTTYEIDSTNDTISLTVDGVLISATAVSSSTATLDAYIDAVNATAAVNPPIYQTSGRFLSSFVVTASVYDRITFHYTGDQSGLSGSLTATITPATYSSVSTLASAVQSAIATQVASLGAAFTGLTISVDGNADGRLEFSLQRPTGVASTGTVTAATVINGNTVTIDGTVFTAVSVARTPGGNDFDRSGSDIACATDLVAAINDEDNWPGTPPVTATNVGGTSATVTITAASVGTDGDTITLASSGATLTVSGANLTGGQDPDASGYLEFLTGATAARDFCVIAGIDTAATTGGAQVKLVDGPIARRFTITGDSTSSLIYDRLILRNRLVPGYGTVHPAHTLSQAGIEILGGTGSALTGLRAGVTALAGVSATVQNPSLLGLVGYVSGQVAAATYTDARDGQPIVTFYGAGGTTAQNNVFKISVDGVPITVTFTDATGTSIASGGSADVPLGPGSSANTVIGQIRAAFTAAGLSSVSSKVVQEGAAIRIVSGLSSSAARIVIGNGSANDVLGFTEAATAERSGVSAKVLASALMAHSAASVASTLNGWDSPSSTYFAAEALAGVEIDVVGREFLYLQSQGTAGLGTTSSLSFLAASSDSVLLPGTGLGVVSGDGATGDPGISGFFVRSSDSANGSGTANTSFLNSGVGQDGHVGQTYIDLVTGLTFTILDRDGGSDYPSGSTLTFKVRREIFTDSSNPTQAIPCVQVLVTNTFGVGVGDTALVQTFRRSGEEPANGDSYFISYEYLKQDFSTKLFTRFSDIEAEYGLLSPDNPVTLASYLAFQNGAMQVAVKQVKKDIDEDGDGIPDAASETAFKNAVDSLKGNLSNDQPPSILVPLKGDSVEFFKYLAMHADMQSDFKHRSERTVIAGVSSGTSPKAAGVIAQTIGRTRFRLVYPDILTVELPQPNGGTKDVLVDGTYLAAMVAGWVVDPARDVATPWTNKRLRGAKNLARVLSIPEQDQVAVKGVTVITSRDGALRIRHGLTTDMTGASTGGNAQLSQLPTIIQIMDEVNQQTRATLDRFIGEKNLFTIVDQIEGQLTSTLKKLVEQEIIAAYANVKAIPSPTDPTTVEVRAFVQPIFPLLYINVYYNLRSRVS